jgi:hypothetical protein
MIPADPAVLRPIVDEIIEAVRADLAADGVPPELMSIGLGAELRFHRQKFELEMDWPPGIDEKSQRTAMRQFTEDYAARYGRGALVSGAPAESAVWRSRCCARGCRPPPRKARSRSSAPRSAR